MRGKCIRPWLMRTSILLQTKSSFQLVFSSLHSFTRIGAYAAVTIHFTDRMMCRPAYLAYGAFGHVAAHELTHAFDSAGRMYNQQGKLEEWWTNTTTEGFQKKQDCIVQQYSGEYGDKFTYRKF